jgi:hypothetical protein
MRASFITDPIRGTVPIGRVIWLYGIVGSLVYGALELFIDPGAEWTLRLYSLGGIAYTLYVTIATYRCAATIRSPFWRQATRVGAVIMLLLLPGFAYLDLSGDLGGALALTGLGGSE